MLADLILRPLEILLSRTKIPDAALDEIEDGIIVFSDRQKCVCRRDRKRKEQLELCHGKHGYEKCDTDDHNVPEVPEPQLCLRFEIIRIEILFIHLVETSLLPGDGSPEIDCRSGRVDRRHHIDLDACIETELLCDVGNFSGCKHDTETEKHIILPTEQSAIQ